MVVVPAYFCLDLILINLLSPIVFVSFKESMYLRLTELSLGIHEVLSGAYDFNSSSISIFLSVAYSGFIFKVCVPAAPLPLLSSKFFLALFAYSILS